MKDYTSRASTHLIEGEVIDNDDLVNHRLVLAKGCFFTKTLILKRLSNNTPFDNYVVELPDIHTCMRSGSLAHWVLCFPEGLPEPLMVTYQALDNGTVDTTMLDNYLLNIVNLDASRYYYDASVGQPVEITQSKHDILRDNSQQLLSFTTQPSQIVDLDHTGKSLQVFQYVNFPSGDLDGIQAIYVDIDHPLHEMYDVRIVSMFDGSNDVSPGNIGVTLTEWPSTVRAAYRNTSTPGDIMQVICYSDPEGDNGRIYLTVIDEQGERINHSWTPTMFSNRTAPYPIFTHVAVCKNKYILLSSDSDSVTYICKFYPDTIGLTVVDELPQSLGAAWVAFSVEDTVKVYSINNSGLLDEYQWVEGVGLTLLNTHLNANYAVLGVTYNEEHSMLFLYYRNVSEGKNHFGYFVPERNMLTRGPVFEKHPNVVYPSLTEIGSAQDYWSHLTDRVAMAIDHDRGDLYIHAYDDDSILHLPMQKEFAINAQQDPTLVELLDAIDNFSTDGDAKTEQGLMARLESYQSLVDNSLETNNKSIVEAINEIIALIANLNSLIINRQPADSELLETEAKSIVGAINELVTDLEELTSTKLTGLIYESRITSSTSLTGLVGTQDVKMWMVGADDVVISAPFSDGTISKTLHDGTMLLWDPSRDKVVVLGQEESINAKLVRYSDVWVSGDFLKDLNATAQMIDYMVGIGEFTDYTYRVSDWKNTGDPGYFVADGDTLAAIYDNPLPTNYRKVSELTASGEIDGVPVYTIPDPDPQLSNQGWVIDVPDVQINALWYNHVSNPGGVSRSPTGLFISGVNYDSIDPKFSTTEPTVWLITKVDGVQAWTWDTATIPDDIRFEKPLRNEIVLRKHDTTSEVTTAGAFSGGALHNPHVIPLYDLLNAHYDTIVELEGKTPLKYEYNINTDTTISSPETSTFWSIGGSNAVITGDWFDGSPSKNLLFGDLVFYHAPSGRLGAVRYGSMLQNKLTDTPPQLADSYLPNFGESLSFHYYLAMLLASRLPGYVGERYGVIDLTPECVGNADKWWLMVADGSVVGPGISTPLPFSAGNVIQWKVFNNKLTIVDMSTLFIPSAIGQPRMDLSLQTNDKSILGAIEELQVVNTEYSQVIGNIYLSDTDQSANGIPLGSAPVSRTLYPELFAVIGTKYGAGDGSTTFGIPEKTLPDDVLALTRGGAESGIPTNDNPQIAIAMAIVEGFAEVRFLRSLTYSQYESLVWARVPLNGEGRHLGSTFYQTLTAHDYPGYMSATLMDINHVDDVYEAAVSNQDNGDSIVWVKRFSGYTRGTTITGTYYSVRIGPWSRNVFVAGEANSQVMRLTEDNLMSTVGNFGSGTLSRLDRDWVICEKEGGSDEARVFAINASLELEEYTWTAADGMTHVRTHFTATPYQVYGIWYNHKTDRLFVYYRNTSLGENYFALFDPMAGTLQKGPNFLSPTGAVRYPDSSYPQIEEFGVSPDLWGWITQPVVMTGDVDTNDLMIHSPSANEILSVRTTTQLGFKQYIKH